MKESDMGEAVDRLAREFSEARLSYIAYVWSEESGLGTGFNSRDCDIGDALTAICRIIEQFNLDVDRMYIAVRSKLQGSN